ncbi:MAG: hypothetical protein R2773_02135 [Flavobacteriaceae bacterium]
MKKAFLTATVICLTALAAHSQSISPNAIGLRLGDNDGFGTEVSYQRALGDNNRLEFDLGWRSSGDFDAYRITGLYHWVWTLDGNFNWYVGAGGGLAQVSFDNPFPNGDDSETYLYAAGDFGLEYDFDIPLLLSLDFRPEFGFGNYNDDVGFDIALGIRYQF